MVSRVTDVWSFMGMRGMSLDRGGKTSSSVITGRPNLSNFGALLCRVVSGWEGEPCFNSSNNIPDLTFLFLTLVVVGGVGDGPDFDFETPNPVPPPPRFTAKHADVVALALLVVWRRERSTGSNVVVVVAVMVS